MTPEERFASYLKADAKGREPKMEFIMAFDWGIKAEAAVELYLAQFPKWKEQKKKLLTMARSGYGQRASAGNGHAFGALAKNEDNPTAVEYANGDKTRRIGGMSYQIGTEIKAKRIEWFWPDRFPLGKVSMIAGFPDQGKSQLTCNIAAIITRGGSWPNGEGKAQQGAVIIVSSEDDADDTIVPRLKAAGADMNQIIIVNPMVTVMEDGKRIIRVFNIEEDLKKIENIITVESKTRPVRAIIFDPLNAYFGGSRIDSNKTSDMRALLTPLSMWAATKKIGVIAIGHFNKGNNAHVLYRVTDSAAITAVCRAVWYCASEDDNPNQFFMLPGKKNIGKKMPGLAYTIDDKDIGELGIVAPFIVWGEATDKTAIQVIGGRGPATKDAVTEAKEFLQSILSDGPVETSVIKEEAGDRMIAAKTLRNAREQLNLTERHKGFGKNQRHTWELPATEKDFG